MLAVSPRTVPFSVAKKTQKHVVAISVRRLHWARRRLGWRVRCEHGGLQLARRRLGVRRRVQCEHGQDACLNRSTPMMRHRRFQRSARGAPRDVGAPGITCCACPPAMPIADAIIAMPRVSRRLRGDPNSIQLFRAMIKNAASNRAQKKRQCCRIATTAVPPEIGFHRSRE